MWLSELYYLCNAKYVLDNRPFYSIFCHVADPHLLWAMPSSKRTIGAPHLMLPMMVASSMMQNPFMWSSTPATNSGQEEEEAEKGPGEEAEPCDQGQHHMQQSFNVDHTSCAAFILCVRRAAKFSPASGPETSDN